MKKHKRWDDESASIHYRVIAAIQSRRLGGESYESLAHDYALPLLVIKGLCYAADQCADCVPDLGERLDELAVKQDEEWEDEMRAAGFEAFNAMSDGDVTIVGWRPKETTPEEPEHGQGERSDG